MIYSPCSGLIVQSQIMPILAKNKEVGRNFQIMEEFEAGIALTGAEVKSAKNALISFKGCFVSIKNGQAWVKNLFISHYQKDGLHRDTYQPNRDRRLLMHKKEIQYLWGKTHAEALTIVPLFMYTSRRLVKLKLALARGKKKFDKRSDIKKREIQKHIAQKLKSAIR